MKLHILCLSQTPSMCKGWPSQVLQSSTTNHNVGLPSASSTTNHNIGLPSASSSVGRLSETGPDPRKLSGWFLGCITVVLKK
jgi:hypothetical protein